MHAQWCDDFHHALHALVTGERDGLLRRLRRSWPMATSYRRGSSTRASRRASATAPRRAAGRRRAAALRGLRAEPRPGRKPANWRTAVEPPAVREPEARRRPGAALAVLPLLFAGEEYGEPRRSRTSCPHRPRAGRGRAPRRAEEFAGFFAAEGEELPDPQAAASFEAARLDRSRRDTPEGRALLDLHRELLRLRRECAPLLGAGRRRTEVVGRARPAGAAGAALARRRGGAVPLPARVGGRLGGRRRPGGRLAGGARLGRRALRRPWSGPSGRGRRARDRDQAPLLPRAAKGDS